MTKRPTTPISFSIEKQPRVSTKTPARTPKAITDIRYHGEPISLDTWHPTTPLFFGPLSEQTTIDALGRIVQQLFGVVNVQYHDVVEGTNNRNYIFNLASKRSSTIPESIICRLSRPGKVDSLLDIRSEIATTMYVRDKMSVPIPQVYAYSTNLSLLGTTFIIMQHITGCVPLSDVIHTLSPPAQEEVARQYARIVFQLSRMRFTQMGSIRQGKDGVFGVASMSLPRGDRMARMMTSTYRSIRRSFPSVQEWAEAMERTELKFLEEHFEVVTAYYEKAPDPEEEAIAAVKRANEAMVGVIHALRHSCSGDALSKTFCLWHPELNPSNLLVRTSGLDAGSIVGVIDWEGAAVMPMWMVTKTPSFLLNDPFWTPYESIYRQELERLDPRRTLVQAADSTWDLQRGLVEVVLQPWSAFEAREAWLDEYRQWTSGMRHTNRPRRSWTLTLGWGAGVGMKKRSQTM